MTESPYKKLIISLSILFCPLGLATVILYGSVIINNSYDKQYIYYANELRVITQRIAKHSIQAVFRGDAEGFRHLKELEKDLENYINILKNGKFENGKEVLPPSEQSIQKTQLKAFVDYWNMEKGEVDYILSNQDIDKSVNDLKNLVSKSLKIIGNNYLAVMKELANQKNIAEKLLMLDQTVDSTLLIEKLLNSVLDTQNITPPENYELYLKVIDELSQRIKKIKENLPEVKDSNEQQAVDKALQIIQESVDSVIVNGKRLDQLQRASNNLFNSSIDFLEAATNLADAYSNATYNRFATRNMLDLISTIAVINLLILFYFMYKDKRLDVKITEKKNKDLRDEVNKLVAEISGFAHGDLAIHASVSEGVTRDVAIAINYALETLRKLVSNIFKTTEAVSSSALEVNKIIEELAQSSKTQTDQIAEVTTSSNTMNNWVEDVSHETNKSAEIAQKSTAMASDGGKVVRDTLEGMERIHSQIQETAGKVRRLSESSQEISEIVSLIDDIAEQTNILSLNASIQAAMAGEAGKGFAVVADEVQRLAEKASYATKEIESLVRSIQNDTNKVITSMEETRTEVVHGVTLAKDAGLSLEKIEKISQELAALIQQISLSSDAQTKMSKNILSMMNGINEIAKKTFSGTTNSAELIASLTKLALDLRNSVSEFKLPNVINHE